MLDGPLVPTRTPYHPPSEYPPPPYRDPRTHCRSKETNSSIGAAEEGAAAVGKLRDEADQAVMAVDARHGPSQEQDEDDEQEGELLPPSAMPTVRFADDEREDASFPAENSHDVDPSFETSWGSEGVVAPIAGDTKDDVVEATPSPPRNEREGDASSSPNETSSSSSSSFLRSWRRRRYPPDATPDFARHPPTTAIATSSHAHTTTASSHTTASSRPPRSTPRRCYRLNLERPFDLHCEPSPLEYGDYMAPWEEGALPPTVGPVEYCPPRHLGGRGGIWRELLKWEQWREEEMEKEREGEERNGTTEQNEVPAKLGGGGGWRKLTPAEERAAKRLGERDPVSGEYTFETYDWSHVVSVNMGRRGMGDRAEDATGTAGLGGNDRDGSGADLGDWSIRDSVRSEVGLATLKEDSSHHHHDHDHQADSTDIPSPPPHPHSHPLPHPSRSESSSSSDEEAMHPNAMFASKPLSYADEQTDPPNSSWHPLLPFRTGPTPSIETPDDEPLRLHTVVSLDSETSREEALRRKTDDELAEDTARLFRRSELSLREARERREAMEEEERRKREREEREKEGGYARSHSHGSGGSLRRKSSLSLGSTKKLLRSLSKVMSELNGTPSNVHSNNRTGSGSGIGTGGADRKASLQAATIEKARDLIDDDDCEEDCDDPSRDERPATPRKAQLNISLYILGEYDILNDLVNDGAKRLSRGKDVSDWEMLRQNQPCPPPNRWVRPTGWVRCNPSCGYAASPPEGYDIDGRKNGVMEKGEEDKGGGAFSNLTSSSSRLPSGSESSGHCSFKEDGKDSPGSEGGEATSSSTSSPRPELPVTESTSSPKHSYGTHATDSTAAPSTSTEGDVEGDGNEVLSNRSSATGHSSAASPDGSSSATAPSPHPSGPGTAPMVATPVPTKGAPSLSTASMSVAASHFNSKPSGGVNDGMVSSASKAKKSLGKRFAMFGKKNRR